MNPNRLKAALARGEVQIGTWINMVRNPAILRLLQAAGLDYARVDMEHSSFSMETVADMAVLSRALDFPIAVRPPEGNREWITRLLDAGIWILHVPQVDTPEIAEEVVQAALYAPEGLRGMSGLGPHTEFEVGAPGSHNAFMNRQIYITAMLESRRAFENLEEIAAVPGINALTLGPSDLAQELGVMGTPDQATVIDEHRDRLIDAARRHNLDVAMLTDSVEAAQRWIKAGVKLISYGSEVAVLRAGYAEVAKRLKSEA